MCDYFQKGSFKMERKLHLDETDYILVLYVSCRTQKKNNRNNHSRRNVQKYCENDSDKV